MFQPHCPKVSVLLRWSAILHRRLRRQSRCCPGNPLVSLLPLRRGPIVRRYLAAAIRRLRRQDHRIRGEWLPVDRGPHASALVHQQGRVRHAQAQAFPGGHPQERAVGFVYFLNKHGRGLIDRLNEDLPLDQGTHWVITV